MYHNSGLNILSGFAEYKFAADEHTVHQRLYDRLNKKVQWPKENEKAETQLSTNTNYRKLKVEKHELKSTTKTER